MYLLSYPAAIRGFMAVILAVMSFFSTLFGRPSIPHGEIIDTSGYELVWSDEFDGDSLDTATWRLHCGGGNNSATIERKGGYWNMALCSVKDGNLHIATKYYENGPDGNGNAGWYTCGIDTGDSFLSKYGYYECRCILPKGAGLWSAFWLFVGEVENENGTGKDGTEIDVFESSFYSTKYPESVQGALHYDGYGEGHKQTVAYHAYTAANNPYEEYNTYGLKWTETEYVFYINGIEVGRTDFGGVSEVPEYMIFSVEVGGNNGTPADSWVGVPITTNSFAPTDFIVDYVRVYQ